MKYSQHNILILVKSEKIKKDNPHSEVAIFKSIQYIQISKKNFLDEHHKSCYLKLYKKQ